MTEPRCSIIIAAYNAEETISRAVNSALAQSIRDIEVVVIDDGSGDATGERAREAGAGDPRLHVVSNTTNLGVSASRNRGLALAAGRWIAILDADDSFERNRVERLIDLAEARDADLLADNLQCFDARSPATGRAAFPEERMATDAPISAAAFASFDRPRWGLQAAGYMKPILRRSFLDRNSLVYPIHLISGEDFHLYMECLFAGARLYFTSEALYNYMVYQTSLSRSRTDEVRSALMTSSRALLDGAERAGDIAAQRELASRHRDLQQWIEFESFMQAIHARDVPRALKSFIGHSSPISILVRLAANVRYDLATRLGIELRPALNVVASRSSTQLCVAFIDQVGRTAGGAERTLATFLKFCPADITPIAVLFEEGQFAQELRALQIETIVLSAPKAVASATRDRGVIRAAIEAPVLILDLVRFIRRRRPNVVFTNSMKAHLLGIIAAALTKTPCVVHFHDIFRGAALRLLQFAVRFGSRKRIACSRLVADNMNVGATTVIYGPVEVGAYAELPGRDIARRNLGISNDLPIVALIGRINRWKGHDRFVRIAAIVNETMPVNFAIVGAPIFRDADFVPELVDLVKQLGLSSRVTFHPWVEDVREIYAAIDLNANCSTREPFGRTMVEASAAGVPTICFADSGAAETIVDGSNGCLIEPGNEQQFATAVIRLLSHRPELIEMARQARATSLHFDASVIAAAMADVIRASV